MRRVCLILACLLPTMDVASLHAEVVGQIKRVGLFSGVPRRVRSGAWTLAEVELRWIGDKPFEGKLCLDQLDRDGDVVTAVEPVALAPNAELRSFQIYFIPYALTQDAKVRVRLYDAGGRLVKVTGPDGKAASDMESPPLLDLPSDEVLLVCLSSTGVPRHARWLDSDILGKAEQTNARKVMGLAPKDLPRRWHGLASVDAILWDNADPSELSEQQLEALIGWVHAGGRLLITAGNNWQALSASRLTEILPATLAAPRETSELREFTQIVRSEEYERELDRHYAKNPVLRCELKPTPTAMKIPADCETPPEIAYRRWLGRGMVTLVGASIQQLLPAPARLTRLEQQNQAAGEPSDFPVSDRFVLACETVIAQNFLRLPPVREDPRQSWLMAGWEPRSLFNDARRSIGFESLSATFLISAILFAIAYTFLATMGTYWFLDRRKWKHHCWTAFAAVGLVGSLLGVGMVWTLRGFSTRVWQTAAVDGQSGLDYAYATCLIGIRTPDHTRLNLRLPGGDPVNPADRNASPIWAMPETTRLDMSESRYVSPESYESVLAGDELNNVPVRATLKEFQARWHGPLGGTLEGKLVALRVDDPVVRYEFGRGSYIRNHLGVNLHDCYILETLDEVAETAARVGCFYLGELPTSGPDSNLDGETIARRLFFEKSRAGPEGAKRITKWPWLEEHIRTWVNELPGGGWLGAEQAARAERLTADQEYRPLLLLSVYNLIVPDRLERRQVRRSHGRTLDVSSWLTSRTAVLIGWTDESPPVTVQIDGDALQPSKARTIYRFVIPVERPRRR